MLALYRPKNAAEVKSGKRKRLQVAAINNALSVWREPNGCHVLVDKMLQTPVLHMQTDEKKQSLANLTSC